MVHIFPDRLFKYDKVNLSGLFCWNILSSTIILRVTHSKIYIFCTYLQQHNSFNIIFHLLGNSTIPVIRVPIMSKLKPLFFVAETFRTARWTGGINSGPRASRALLGGVPNNQTVRRLVSFSGSLFMGLAEEDEDDALRACVCNAHSQDPCVSVDRSSVVFLSLSLSIFTYASHLLAHLVRWLSVLRDQVFKSLNYYLPRFFTWQTEFELLMKWLLDWIQKRGWLIQKNRRIGFILFRRVIHTYEHMDKSIVIKWLMFKRTVYCKLKALISSFFYWSISNLLIHQQVRYTGAYTYRSTLKPYRGLPRNAWSQSYCNASIKYI